MKKKFILIMMAVTVIASSASVSNLMVYAEDFSDHESLTLNAETDEKSLFTDAVGQTAIQDQTNYKNSEKISCLNSVEDSGSCGDSAYWKLLQDGTLIIYGSGEMYGADFDSYEIKKVEITEGITRIDDYTFEYSSSLEMVSISDSVKEIGDSAFYGCERLTEVTGGDNLEIIGDEAFGDCAELKNITLSSSIQEVGDMIFEGCESLKTAGPASGNYNIKLKSTESLPDSLLAESEVTEVVLPDSLKKLGIYVFYNCSSLEKINIPNSVKEIGASAFEGCSKLTEVTGGNNLEKIGIRAFGDCEELENITLSSSIGIAERIFEGCESLKTAGPASGNYNIKLKFTESLPDGLLVSSEVTEIVLPDSLKDLGIMGAFGNCQYLEKIQLPSSLTNIPMWAFFGCSSLEKINIPDSVKEIGNHAFMWCDKLTEVTGGNNVEKIGGSAFSGCPELRNITLSSSVKEIESGVFDDNIVIHGYKNSYAETYAKENNISFVPLEEVEIEPAITLNNDSGILSAELNTIDNIIEHGFVYGKETDVTLDTPGRTRVAYSEFDSDKSYSFDTTDLTGCAIRAYVIYIDKNGNEQTVYSNIYSR